jgi:hypothetical protein
MRNWKPRHGAPSPGDEAVVLTPEELAAIEGARKQRSKDANRRAGAAFKARLRAKREVDEDAATDPRGLP